MNELPQWVQDQMRAAKTEVAALKKTLNNNLPIAEQDRINALIREKKQSIRRQHLARNFTGIPGYDVGHIVPVVGGGSNSVVFY